MTVDDLNRLDAASATSELWRCCGSTRWAEAMAASRPFVDAEALAARADAVWWSLEPSDWLEAFAAHPRIGQSSAPAGASAAKWPTEEQAGATGVADGVRRRLEAGNRDYEARFGYIFIVCATGKSADQMLAILEQRLRNEADKELRIAAEEQRNITRLRLAKLLT